MKIKTKIVLVSLISGLLIFTISAFNINASREQADKVVAIETINEIMNNKYGEMTSAESKEWFNGLFTEDMKILKDDNYIYALNGDGSEINTILQYQIPDKPLFDKVTSIDNAGEIALELTKTACPDFFTSDYDVFSYATGEEYHKSYTIQYWQKTEDKFYTGKKVAVIITEDGYLDSLVSRASEAPVLQDKAEVNYIGENAAISIAYQYLDSLADKLSGDENKAVNDKEIKTIDEDIVSDAYLLDVGDKFLENWGQESEPLHIRINDRESHIIDAYREMNKGEAEWVINISGVQTNKGWLNMSFVVKLDAITGKVNFIDYTR